MSKTSNSKATVREQVVTKQWALYNGDCVEVLPGIKDESAGHVLYSPPFADLFSYSDSDRDMGNCRDYDEFFTHFQFLASELMRVLMPGRIMAVHCMDLPIHQNKEGYSGTRDFSGDLIRCFQKEGFIYHCPRITIWKDPLIAATRTHAKNLAHGQIVKDSAACGIGTPDHIVVMRKPGDNPEPIRHPEGLTEYAGSREIPRHLNRFAGHADQRTNKRSHWIWQQYASPVWMDIRQTKVLPYRKGKEEDDQRHICPLQTDTIERCLTLWSNPGDVVLSPFAGVGSEVYVAVKMGRRGVGIELKPTYYRQAVRNLESLKYQNAGKVGKLT